jgi:hypothetical protein
MARIVNEDLNNLTVAEIALLEYLESLSEGSAFDGGVAFLRKNNPSNCRSRRVNQFSLPDIPAFSYGTVHSGADILKFGLKANIESSADAFPCLGCANAHFQHPLTENHIGETADLSSGAWVLSDGSDWIEPTSGVFIHHIHMTFMMFTTGTFNFTIGLSLTPTLYSSTNSHNFGIDDVMVTLDIYLYRNRTTNDLWCMYLLDGGPNGMLSDKIVQNASVTHPLDSISLSMLGSTTNEMFHSGPSWRTLHVYS